MNFVSRFESDTTDGQGEESTTVSQSVSTAIALSVGPYRLKNLYFSYLVVLRVLDRLTMHLTFLVVCCMFYTLFM